MEKQSKTNNAFVVFPVLNRLFGKDHTTKNSVNSTGLSFGSTKAIQSDSSAISQVIVRLNSSKSKIIGLRNHSKNSLTTQNTDILSMTPLTSTNTDVSLAL